MECGSAWQFDPPTAFDLGCGTNVTFSIVSTVTNVITPCLTTITRTWQATDCCTNLASCSQTVTVLDSLAPDLTCSTNKTVECGSAWSFDEPIALEQCSGTNVVLSVVSTVTNGTCPQVITRTWSAIDECGNSNTCAQVVLVNCGDCLVLTKVCPPNPVPPGGLMTFTGSISNLSGVVLTNVFVYNDKPVTHTLVYGPATLAPGQGASFSGTYTVPVLPCGPYQDTLWASGTTPSGFVLTNSVTATCPAATVITPGDQNGDGIVSQAELDVVLSNYWMHSPWVSMTNSAALGRGVFQFALTNATGWNFTVLATTNFVDWTMLPGPAYPVYQFYDPEGTNAPNRYYRLTWP